ncbi:hypothetical protein ACTZ9G_000094 [Acinetobacter baumannii]|uniref:hypothetical protein n=1 Tax=Acinetobacter baumannii TaxID=470 RepID=UPI001B63B4E7|nr:hypothetical protein [Acinetobacter baumannii]EKT9381717.1 hypothetical protein [Acinetobacter baumannii]EKT9385424.1 hypothetical protein [Acinetobacter baumannii]EKT9860431.1 hypothetical protein [Acinetobacter baumannii]EKT9864169.1 hypothetical protein [Acinetobacter baumannii]EKT9905188.1 hypothetical protein [Acinetobacter baumannii]
MKNYILALAIILTGCSGEPEITLPDVKQVGLNDDNAVIQSIGEQPKKVIDSNDDAKKIYIFDGAYSQLELSSNYALVAWQQNNDASLKRAVKMGMALLGNDAGYFIHRVNMNGEHADYSIQGHKIVNNTCISELCMIKIEK